MCQCAATLSDAALNGHTTPCNQALVFPPYPPAPLPHLTADLYVSFTSLLKTMVAAVSGHR